jgi:hypothetical protein
MGRAEEVLRKEVQCDSVLKENFSDVQVTKFFTQFPAFFPKTVQFYTYAHIYVIHTYIQKYIHTYIHTYIHNTYICTYIHTHTYIHTYIHMHIHIRTFHGSISVSQRQ